MFHGSLLVDGGPVEIRVTSEPEGLRLTTPEGGDWLLRHGAAGSTSDDAPARWLADSGPLEMLRRVLALACRGRFCLHASAVRVDETRVVALLGESGSGKSTLARLIHERTRGGWPRVADDVLPAWPEGDQVCLDLSFPQVGLQAGEHCSVEGESALTLVAVYVLEQAADAGAPVTCRTLRPFEAVAAIAGNTMSARLFDARLLDSHLGFSRDVAARVPVRALSYPHRRGAAADIVAMMATGLHLPPPEPGGSDGR